MEFIPDEISGMPVHPLVVHAVVVLVPLAGVLGLAMLTFPRFSVRFGPLVVLLAWMGVGASFVAKESGERLARDVGASAQHVSAGDMFPAFALAQAVLLTVMWLADRRGGMAVTRVVLALITGLVILATLAWSFRTGDSGARQVWG